jgi:hypothetical protein
MNTAARSNKDRAAVAGLYHLLHCGIPFSAPISRPPARHMIRSDPCAFGDGGRGGGSDGAVTINQPETVAPYGSIRQTSDADDRFGFVAWRVQDGADPAGACGHHVRHTASLSSPDRSALLLRIIPSFWRVSLELLEKTVFPFASRPRL